MKSNLCLTTTAALLLALSANAKGLLGEKYFGVEIASASIESVDGWGAGFVYNRPFTADNEYGLDFHIAFATLEGEEFDVDFDGQSILGGVTLYPIKTMEMKPFIAAGIGYSEASIETYDEEAFTYQFAIGGEWQASDTVTVRPYWLYTDSPDFADSGQGALGIEASVWLKDEYNLGLSFERTSIEGYNLDVLSFLFRKSF